MQAKPKHQLALNYNLQYSIQHKCSETTSFTPNFLLMFHIATIHHVNNF